MRKITVELILGVAASLKAEAVRQGSQLLADLADELEYYLQDEVGNPGQKEMGRKG